MQQTNHSTAPTGNFLQRHGNAITLALWIIVLSSHLILLPKFIKEVVRKS